jgi:hypothetical protein
MILPLSLVAVAVAILLLLLYLDGGHRSSAGNVRWRIWLRKPGS